jgi:hypothetical protein
MYVSFEALAQARVAKQGTIPAVSVSIAEGAGKFVASNMPPKPLLNKCASTGGGERRKVGA